jgi:hypothetical protein
LGVEILSFNRFASSRNVQMNRKPAERASTKIEFWKPETCLAFPLCCPSGFRLPKF